MSKPAVRVLSAALVALSPLVSLAAVSDIIAKINEEILNPFIILLVAVALLVFFWNLVILLSTADGDKISAAKGKMIWSLIGLAIMISFVGIMNLIIDTWTSLE